MSKLLAPAFAAIFLAAAGLAQAPAKSAAQKPVKATAPARSADGHVDLSGVWTHATTVPVERPKELGSKEFYTAEEIQANAKRAADRAAAQATQETGDLAVHYDTVQFGLTGSQTQRAASMRTSIITGPEGRIPPVLPAAAKRNQDRNAARLARQWDSYEFRPLAERCYTWGNVGPPMMPVGYNSNMEIRQSPGYMVIVQEMIHDARVIPTDGRPQISSGIQQWFGSPSGRWEGDTLVVETGNFTNRTNFRGSSDQLKVTERFMRSGPDSITYQFTVSDPATWEKSWSGEVSMAKMDTPLYEYACHEGNYGMSNILTGVRVEEAKAAKK